MVSKISATRLIVDNSFRFDVVMIGNLQTAVTIHRERTRERDEERFSIPLPSCLVLEFYWPAGDQALICREADKRGFYAVGMG